MAQMILVRHFYHFQTWETRLIDAGSTVEEETAMAFDSADQAAHEAGAKFNVFCPRSGSVILISGQHDVGEHG